ncbi:MAG: VOC family protein [Dehalococcoidia bacterium]
MFKVLDLHHVAVLAHDLDAASDTFRHNFGFEVESRHEMPQFNLRNAFLAVGPGRLELLAPIDEAAHPGTRLAQAGEGLYHIALRVDDLDAAAAYLREKGIEASAPSYVADVAARVVAISPRHSQGASILLLGT